MWTLTQSVNTLNDVTKCYITSILVFSATKIILADNLNKCVKMMINFDIISELYLSATPWELCKINSDKVAVAVDDGVHIIFVHDDRLVNERKITFQHACRGIALYKDILNVSSGTAQYKKILNGTHVYKLYEDKSGHETVYKCGVSPSGESIYTINRPQHKLIILAKNGTVSFTFTDSQLQWPRGLHVTTEGMLLICGSQSNTIILVDGESWLLWQHAWMEC